MIASVWDVVRAELLRLETQGKDDHRDSWMGNAIKAINRLEEHCEKHGAYMSEQLFDVVAVNMSTQKVRVLAESKLGRDAEAIVKMAVGRRGVEDEFFVEAVKGKYKDGDTWSGSL